MYVLIQPDVLKVEKCYWYKSESDFIIGSIVRVLFNGRKVRGWIVQYSKNLPQGLEATKVKNIIEFVSCGPNVKMVEFSFELAKYYLTSPVVFLRMFSPDVKVPGWRGSTLETQGVIATKEVRKDRKRNVIYVNARENRRELILENVSKTGSTIIMTPDSRMRIASFLREMGNKVVVIGVDGKITKEIYQQMNEGNCVVISSRKAIFANVSDLDSIVILDDGFEQLRDERTPKFHGVDVAKLRSEKENCDITVITSVPTVVTHELNIVDKRHKDAWPQIHIEDLTKVDPTLGIFTHIVLRDIKKAKELGGDVAFITNNTSMARKLVCAKCQNVCTCDNCGHNVGLSADDTQLVCEVCNKSRAKICNSCGSTKLKKYRKGTKSLSGELAKLIQNSTVIEIEKDKDVSDELINDRTHKIFIGTESIFHKRNITRNIALIIFVDFDSYLLRPRSDAFEQSLISVTRAIRLLKRTDLNTPVLLLTRLPDHEMIKDLLTNDFVSHLSRDLELKKQLGVAPFRATAQAKVRLQDYGVLRNSIDKGIIDGDIVEGDFKTLALSAANHDELTQKAYDSLRNFASKHRLALAVDSYE